MAVGTIWLTSLNMNGVRACFRLIQYRYRYDIDCGVGTIWLTSGRLFSLDMGSEHALADDTI